MAGNILGSLLLNIVTKSDDSGLRKTDRSLRKIGTTAKTVAKNTSLLGSLSKKFMGGFNISNIGNWFNSYLQFEKDLGAMQSRFYAITHSEKESAEEFEYIRKLATDTALDIKKTADSYSIFYSATRNALGKEGARGVYEAWTQVGRVLHLSDYQMERVTYALREMASKGAIYSQDLRMQIGTHVPNAMGLAQKAAEEMGFTGVDWFTKLQEAAKGNTKLTAEFVQKFSKQAQMMYASPEALKKAMQQPDALAKQIANFRYNFGVEFSKAGGSYMIVKILQGTLAFIKTIPFYEIADKLGMVAKTVGDMAVYLPQILTILKDIAITMLIFTAIGKVGRALVGAKSLFSVLGKGVGARFLARFGLGALLRRALLEAGAKIFLGTTFKTALALGLNAIPVIGQIASAVMLIWTAVDVIRGLLGIISKDKAKDLDDYLKIHGLSREYITNTIKNVSVGEVTDMQNPLELQRRLKWYIKDKEVRERFILNDYGTIVFDYNGEQLTENGAKEGVINSKKEITKHFNKPNFFKKDIRGTAWD